MLKSSKINYADYLRTKNKLELDNSKIYQAKYKNSKGLIDQQTTDDIINSLNVNDNPLSLHDSKIQLGEYLSKYIKNPFFINKIIDSPKLTDSIQNQLVLNWETSVVPRLNALSKSNLSVDKLILLLENIGIQLIASSSNIEINNKLNYLKNVFNNDIKKYEGELLNKSLPVLIQDLVNDNINQYTKEGINQLSKNAKSIKDYKDIIYKIAKIDRCQYNYSKIIKIYKPKYSSNIQVIENQNLNDIKSLPENYLTKNIWKNVLKEYREQALTYDGITLDEITPVYLFRKTHENKQEPPLDIPNENEQLSDEDEQSSDEDEQSSDEEKPPPLEEVKQETKTGNGLKNRLSEHEKIINKKYFINVKKLKNRILDIRYLNNRHQIKIKQQALSEKMKNILLHLFENKAIDNKTYQELSSLEKHLYRQLLPYFGKERDDVDDIEAFHDRFEVIKGEIMSGNDNLALKKECKAYLTYALNIGLINRSTYYTLITELDL